MGQRLDKVVRPPVHERPEYGQHLTGYLTGRQVLVAEDDVPVQRRGNLVKRNLATDSPGYSFPSASGQDERAIPGPDV